MDERPDSISAIDELYTNPEPLLDIVRMLIALWEKIVVLDAATLALSFTASGFFRDHLTGDGGVGYLAAAWKLLFAGITFCLLAQWSAIQAAASISGLFNGMRVLSLFDRATQESTLRGLTRLSEYQRIKSEIIRQSPKLQSARKAFSLFAGGLGFVGLVSSISAFYWLYRFAHTNILAVRH